VFECCCISDVSLGFGYQFNAIQDETNELFCAYKDMFEIAISQAHKLRSNLAIYFPILNVLYVSFAPSNYQLYPLVKIDLAGQIYTHS
jgi:hypothetical protein